MGYPLVPLLLNQGEMRAFLVSIVLVSSGCLYGKLADIYASALGLNGGAAPAPAPAAPAEPQPEPAPVEVAAAEPPPEQAQTVEPPPQQVVYAPTYVHSTSSTNVTNNVTSTTTYVNAGPRGAPAWIATYPAARGSTQTMCKRFSGTPDNRNACAVECNAQMRFGPGSCSCMDLEACPQGTHIVP